MAHRSDNPDGPTMGALVLWQEKLAYFLEQEVIADDPEKLFALRQKIRDAKARIRELQDDDHGEPEPSFPDEPTRQLSAELDTLYEERAELTSRGADTTHVVEKILDRKRKIREGGKLKPGDLLDGRFKLLESIGRGGFAEVWKAYDGGKKRDMVAVKVLHGQHAHDRSRRERFFRGARHMARLHHQGIVRVVEEDCEDGGFHFFVMEYLPGGDLRDAVLAGGLALGERLRLVAEVGDALAFAHTEGVVHRDVKPGNVLLDRDGRAKLADFDLVRAADSTGGTRTGMLGTVVYAAPELMHRAQDAGPAADVYGLGMTALFALYGKELPLDVLRDAHGFLDTLDVDGNLRDVLAKAVAWKAEERWPGVVELCEALRGVLAKEEQPRKPDPEAPAPVVVAAPPRVEVRERVHEETGMALVYVPGGEYALGAEDLPNAGPVHRVVLSPFWIGKHPVTNEQYRRFLDANSGHRNPEYWSNESFNQPDQPVVGVSWADAEAYCRWAGLTLPSEAQWEAAARGPEGKRYPWGDEEPTAELANFDGNVGRTTPVGKYSAGTGPFGTQDQAGNVWEWVFDVWDAEAYREREGKTDPLAGGEDAVRVVRGGSWAYPSRFLLAAFRGRWHAAVRVQDRGFRVVSVPVPEP